MIFSKRTEWKLAPNRLTLAQQELAARGVPKSSTSPSPIRRGPDSPMTPRRFWPLSSIRQAMDYDPQPKGLLSARQAVAEYYREHEGFRFDPASLILTSSTSEGYSYIFRLLCNPGDEILVPKPSYPLFEFLADLEDVRLAPYPLLYDHGWQIDFPSLYKAVNHHTRAVRHRAPE